MSRLLLIEDDAPLSRALSEFLSRRDFTVLHAADGKHGVEMAMKHRPEIILCDIELPGASGYKILHYLATHGALENTSFFFMTGHPIDMFALQKAQGRVAGFIMKPFDVDELLNTIHQHYTSTPR